MNQGVYTIGVQCYSSHQEPILLDLITESDIYDNYSYASHVNWEIEKTPGTHPKKLEFNIDKPETDLKKIDFNINVNDDEIDDMNDEEVVHSSDNLADDSYNNTENQEDQQEQTKGTDSSYTIIDNLISSSIKLEVMKDTY